MDCFHFDNIFLLAQPQLHIKRFMALVDHCCKFRWRISLALEALISFIQQSIAERILLLLWNKISSHKQ